MVALIRVVKVDVTGDPVSGVEDVGAREELPALVGFNAFSGGVPIGQVFGCEHKAAGAGINDWAEELRCGGF